MKHVFRMCRDDLSNCDPDSIQHLYVEVYLEAIDEEGDENPFDPLFFMTKTEIYGE